MARVDAGSSPALLIGGTKESARLNNIMVAVKLFVVVAFILLGAAYVTSANWHPLIPIQFDRLSRVSPA